MTKKNIEETVASIEEILIARGLLKKEDVHPCPDHCEWCYDEDEPWYGCHACKDELFWHPSTWNEGKGMWVSAECAWLMDECEAAIENDLT